METIHVTFLEQEEWRRIPSARTCGSIFEIDTSYNNFVDFRNAMDEIMEVRRLWDFVQ